MPLLSSFLLIESAAITLIAISVLLVTSPNTVLSSTTLSLLGSSMHIRPATFIPEPPPPKSLATLARTTKTSLTTSEHEILALTGLVIFLTSISTMILAAPLHFSTSSLTSRVSTSSDGGAKTVRKSSAEVGESIARITLVQSVWQGLAGIHVVVAAAFVAWSYVFRSEKYGRRDMGFSVLANNVTFTVGMVDMLFWGYLYTTIKEERREVLKVGERRRTEDEEDEANRT